MQKGNTVVAILHMSKLSPKIPDAFSRGEGKHIPHPRSASTTAISLIE